MRVTKLEKFSLNDMVDIFITQTKSYHRYTWSPRLSQAYLNNSYDIAIQEVQKQEIKNLLNMLPLHGAKINIENVIDNIKIEKELFHDLFTNKDRRKTLKSENHYFDCLYEGQEVEGKNDDGDEEENYSEKKQYFSILTKALVNAYLFHEILKHINPKIIDSLKKVIFELKYLNNSAYTKQIKFYELCLSFFDNKKYTNYYATLTISKMLGLSVKESINYSRTVLEKSSMREDAHTKRYNNIKIYTTDDFLTFALL